MLAIEVNRILQERAWSLMKAQIATGVNRGTINNMKQGMGARPEYIAKFARAIAPKGREAETVRHLLTLAGYPELATVQVTDAGSYEGDEKLFDPLSLVGADVDAGLLRATPFIPGTASASMTNLGEGGSATSTAEDVIPANLRAIEVNGDSMEPAYRSGDILFVNETWEAHDGDEVIAMIGLEGVTCKVYRTQADRRPYLEPYNGEGKIEFPRFTVVGVVVGYYRRSKRRLKGQ